MPNRLTKTLAQALLLTGLGALVVLGAYQAAFRWGLAGERDSAKQHLAFLAANLASALAKYETLPAALAGYPDQLALLREPTRADLRAEVNQRLAQLAERTQAASIYLIDARGETLAASNWAGPTSFVGQNFAYRPYFREALAQGAGRYYAVGTTSGQPGYFLAHRVPDGPGRPGGPRERPLGVVVVKILLDDLEANWRQDPAHLMLADARGVVFLSNRENSKFRTLTALDAPTRAQIAAERQYGEAPLQPLALQGAGADGLARLAGVPMLDARSRVGPLGWTLLSLSAVDEVGRLARGYAAASGFAYAFVLVAVLYARLRRRRNDERQRAQRALEQLHGQLEQRISERTLQLQTANDELEAKLAEIKRTQAALRATQDELVQAGKLTVIGQMAVSITHEINQPLAAFTALNDNALMLLDRGEDDAVHTNLETMRGLAQRMGAIVGQLKGFARKDDVRPSAVPVGPAIAAALAMLAPEARKQGVELVGPAATPLAVQGQRLRIEQVLVNLLRNAVDACADAPFKRVEVSVAEEAGEAGMVSLRVADSGSGIAPEALERLFEPFFTTKPAGVGLGLGLAISGSIANALGGSLQAANRPEGGAVFTLRLPQAPA